MAGRGKYKYWLSEEGQIKLSGWAKSGLTDEQIAKRMRVSRSTLNVWKDKYPEIKASICEEKDIVDFKVENALLKRALGYTSVERIKERHYNNVSKQFELVVVKEIHKDIPPDNAAAMFWLKNRKPDVWRDRVEKPVDQGQIEAATSAIADLINNPVEDRDIHQLIEESRTETIVEGDNHD